MSRKQNEESMVETIIGMPKKPKFLTVTPAQDDSHVVVDIRGVYPCDEEITTEEIIHLRGLAERYDTVKVHIRSDGGSANTMVELISVLQLFNNFHTFGYGSIASAGAITWAAGDVRVLAAYTEVMFHRESYLSYGKIPDHKQTMERTEELYGELLAEYAGDILTEEEMERTKSDEVYITAKTLVDRKCAISIEQYQSRVDALKTAAGIIEVDGVPFLAEGPFLRRILDIELDDQPILIKSDYFNLTISENGGEIDLPSDSDGEDKILLETTVEEAQAPKKKRGRPVGSKNKTKSEDK